MSSILSPDMDEPDALKCMIVNTFNSTEAKCNFTINTDDCSYDGIIYDFTHLAYCDIGDHLRGATLCVLFSILLFLFLSMGVVADEFLCPALLTISKTLRLPDNIAGVTFLAFGNGAPDIFSSISGVSQSKPQLIISSLFGAGVFVTTVVVGSVLLTGEFEVMQRPLMRDIVFYIGAAFMVWFIIWKARIFLKHAIALVVVYLCYICVVVVSRYIYMKTKKGRDSQKENSSNNSTELSTISDNVEKQEKNNEANPEDDSNDIGFQRTKTLSTKSKRADSLQDGDVVLTRFYRKGTLHTPRHSRTESIVKKHLAHHHFENALNVLKRSYDDENNSNDYGYETKRKKPGFFTQLSTISTKSILSVEAVARALTESKEFLIHISPVDIIEWPEYSILKKTMEIVKAVPYFVMTLCIPVVDLESPKDNWCRLLSCINLILAPQVAIFFLQLGDTTVGDFPVWAVTLIITFGLAIVVYLTSNPESPPIYNRVFAFLGFGVSVLFINAIANEVINILETLGIMFSLSDAILGLTILAWGNSLGDLISDITMARHGYPGIGISACFGGPLLNLLLGLGLPYTILLVDGHEEGIELIYSRMVTLLYATITISLTSSLAIFIFNRFHSKRAHGLFLICLYLVYLVIAVLIESNVLN